MLTLNDYFNRKFVSEFFDKLRPQRPSRLLDLGCGAKPFSDYYEGVFDDVTSVDIEVRHEDVDVIAAAEHLPFRTGSFDTVLFSEVIEHVKEDVQAIAEINRVLKDGGYLILTVPFMYRMHEIPQDYRRYTEFGLEHLLNNAGFEVECIWRRGGLNSLLLTIVGNLVHGITVGFSRLPFVGIVFRPLVWLVEVIFQGISRGVALALHSRRALKPMEPGDRLNGLGGYLSAWTLGYCVLAKKVSKP